MEMRFCASLQPPSASRTTLAPWYLLGPMPEEDADLVRRIAQARGKAQDAEEELCRRYGPRARLYGLRHLRNDDLARELAQAVLLRVLVAVRGGRVVEPEHLARFVLGTCRNVAGRMREGATRSVATDPGDLDRVSVMPELEAVDHPALIRCLAGLGERGRRVVLLSFNEERSTEEIAARLETTEGNVRVLRHRAVAQLRRCLDPSPVERS
jgi:RNA polymerase sigma-70 factor, ECF subfamily